MTSARASTWFKLRARGSAALDYLNPRRRRLMSGFDALRQHFFREFWEAACRQLQASSEDLGDGFLRIRRGDDCTFVRGSEVMLDDHLSLKIAGNKRLTYHLMEEHGYRPPRYAAYQPSSVAIAEDFLRTLQGTAVVKPVGGTGAGQGITTKVGSAADLRRATAHAARFSNNLLIEQEVSGHSYRLLYLGGELVDAVRRAPPGVTGNGRDTVADLIGAENRRRLNAPEILALSPLLIDDECRAHLRTVALSPASVIESGRALHVKTVVNQNNRFENVNVRGEVHADVERLGREMVAVLDLELAGVDLIAPSLDAPLEETGGIINEINTTPGLHHHRLTENSTERVDIGPMLLEYVLNRRRRDDRERPALRAASSTS